MDLPIRKHPRLNSYDYSASGAYFVTICTEHRRCVLSNIVGRGLAPAEESLVECTLFGKIAKQQLLLLEQRYPHIKVDQYVIMPNHIHIVFLFSQHTAGASPRPTLMDVVCAYKSLTTRECKKKGLIGRLFQSSFYEHVIRDYTDYEEIANYICNNPLRWSNDDLYTET